MSFYTPYQLQIIANYLPDYLKLKKLFIEGSNTVECLNPMHDKGARTMHLFKGQDGKIRLKCHGCGKSMDLFNVVEKVDDIRQLPNQYDYICGLFHVDTKNPTPSKWGQSFNRRKSNIAAVHAYVEACATDRDVYRKWSTRGIQRSVVQRYRLGYDKENKALVIPIGNLGYVKRYIGPHPRKYDRSEGPMERFYSAPLDFSRPIVIAEGEIDALSLIQFGVKNVVSIGGVGNLEKAYREFVDKAISSIVIAMDRDETGVNAYNALVNMCNNECLPLPENFWARFASLDLTGVKDINDMVCMQNVATILPCFAGLTKEVEVHG